MCKVIYGRAAGIESYFRLLDRLEWFQLPAHRIVEKDRHAELL